MPTGASSKLLARRKVDSLAKVVFLLLSVHPQSSSLPTYYIVFNWQSYLYYCGSACQKSHWPQHRSECKSALGKESWQPAWVLEDRTPAFIGDGIGVTFGGTKYLWGNVPAFDVLKVASNEGEAYSGDLRVLFAGTVDAF